MKVPSAAAAAAWYQKWMGSTIVRQAGSTVAQFPGLNIRFAETSEAVSGTEGRALQMLGFEVSNLETFFGGLKTGGVEIVASYQAVAAQFAPFKAFARIRDAWGIKSGTVSN